MVSPRAGSGRSILDARRPRTTPGTSSQSAPRASRDVQGPGDHAPQPVPGHRRGRDRRHHDGRGRSVHRRQGVLPAGARRGWSGRSRRWRPRACPATRPIIDRRRPRGVPVRRGDRPAPGHRRRRAAAPPVPAVPPRPVRHRAEHSAGRPEPASPAPRPPDVSASNPTLVNNVETLAVVAHVLARGPEWHRASARGSRPGWRRAPSSATSCAPGVAEVEMGTPLGEVIDRVGRRCPPGPAGQGRPVRASPTRSSPADQLDTPVSYEGMAAPAAASARAASSSTTTRPTMVEVAWRRLPVPLRRVVRPVPGLQARHRGDHRRPRATSSTGAATEDDLEPDRRPPAVR